uniref:cAMP-regulated phosphoprotein 19-related protein n=1 Tax=Noccaea caerulescens TaxID=107243 RepID=A0A1J3K0J8_NOCCA
MATDCNSVDDVVFSQQQESATPAGANKYGGLVPRKKPLISKDHKRTFFDSADWALHKQEAVVDERTIAAIENLKPKLQRTPHKQLPPRRPTCGTGQENQKDSSF